jgi:phage tail-like protein
MDVNNTRFHLLLGPRDWSRVIDQTPLRAADVPEWAAARDDRAIAWDDDFGGIALLRRVPLLGAAPRPGTAPAVHRGATADGFGNVFWISEDGQGIEVQPRGARRTGRYWSLADLDTPCRFHGRDDFVAVPLPAPAAAPGPASTLRGIAASTSHHLVVGLEAPAGLLVFDLDAGDAPAVWRWPAALAFRPWLITALPGGGAAVLDHDEATGVTRLWEVDRTFSDVGVGVPIAAALPAGMAALTDGSLLMLDGGLPGAAARIVHLRAGRVLSTHVLDAAFTSPVLEVDVTDARSLAVAFDAPGPHGAINGRAYVVSSRYPQAFEIGLTAEGDALTLQLHARALPLSGGAAPPLVAAGATVLFQRAGRWFALEEQPRYRYLPEAILCEGQTAAQSAMVFDGKDPGCVWHRVVADACIPAGCQVRVRSRAADELDRLERTHWVELHPLALRSDGSELPFDRPFEDASETVDHLGTFETLIRSAEGRYLQLEVTLAGDGRASPKVRALRVYYPRFSYLHRYLPAIYREDGPAADFLDRWLANPEGIFTTIEGRIAAAETVLDPGTAPPEFLPWLGTWFDAVLDPDWDDARRRLFLKFAWLLYKWRGSALGLLAFLRLATEECPEESLFQPLLEGARGELGALGGFSLRIVEDFERRSFPAALLGDPTGAAPGLGLTAGTWRSSQGGAHLHARWREWLLCRYDLAPQAGERPDWRRLLERVSAAWKIEPPLPNVARLRFSAVPPSNAAERADWEAFAAVAFDFPYPAIRSSDVGPWREFLARRYAAVEALNQAWGRTGAGRWNSFAAVPLPAQHQLPPDGTPLADWRDFVALAMPIRRHAHRFTVLVPARVDEDPAARAARLRRVEAIVDAEKPAHTSFQVRPFWALFQVGSARVGLDTVLGESSRFLPLVLDAGYLRKGYLVEEHPWTATDRQVIGRDRLQRTEPWTSTTAAHSPTH